jgi:chromosome partitioning protein
MSGKAWRVAVIAGKGGVGKTTTVINLGAGLAALGRRVLLVDCDPQGNLTSGLGLDPYARRRTVADVIVGRCAAVDAILETETPNLHLIPAHPDLSAVESELPARVNAELRLRNALREGLDAHYDVILFDTPPNFGFHTISALGAARSALVPLQMSAFALRGLKEVIRVIAAARRHLNPELELLGVVPTFVNNTRFSRDMLEALSDVSQVRVFRSEIALTVKLQESALQGVPVMVSAPSSRASRAYSALAQEVAEIAGGRLRPARRPAAPRAEEEVPAPVPDREPEPEAMEDAVLEDDEPVMEMAEGEVDEGVAGDEEDAFEDTGEDLDDGYAITLAGEPTQGAVPLGSAAEAIRHLEAQPARNRVKLEVADGRGGIAIAELPPVGLHAVDEHAGNGHAGADEDGEPAAVEPPAETRQRRRFLFFGRKAS